MITSRASATWYVAMILLGIFVAAVSTTWPYFVAVSPGPALFPTGIAVGLVIAGVTGLRGLFSEKRFETVAENFETVELGGDRLELRQKLKRIGNTFLGIIVFLVTARPLGFIVAVSLMSVIVFLAFAEASNQKSAWDGRLKAAAFAVLIGLVVNIAFTQLGVSLPRGQIVDLLLVSPS